MSCTLIIEESDDSYRLDKGKRFDRHKLSVKVSIEGNETHPQDRVLFFNTNVNLIYSYNANDDITDRRTFIPRYVHDGATLEFGLIDKRHYSNRDKRVTMTVEILYDGKSVDNPDSKLSFYWEDPLTPWSPLKTSYSTMAYK